MPNTETKQGANSKYLDLEIKDAHLIFDSVWNELVEDVGEVNLQFPREIFWLNGAPGAGKGTQTRFVMRVRDLTAPPVLVSSLLKSEAARRLIDAGMMVGDKEVTKIVLRALLEPENQSGVVVDGFPRTKVQVECLKLFYQKLRELRRNFLGTMHEMVFPKPVFHIIVLYVDEPTSVRRQLRRGEQVRTHNEKVSQTGVGEMMEERATDNSEETARNRYRTFKEVTYESLKSLREVFHYHFVEAQGSVEDVQRNILDELRYQSSLELDQPTYDRLAPIPVASQLTRHARQELVSRLDEYERFHSALFARVVDAISQKFLPIIKRHAITGMAFINTEDVVFEDPMALAILIDVFSERGYHAVIDVRREEVPDSVDPKTFKIKTRTKRVYRIRVKFRGSEIRRG